MEAEQENRKIHDEKALERRKEFSTPEWLQEEVDKDNAEHPGLRQPIIGILT